MRTSRSESSRSPSADKDTLSSVASSLYGGAGSFVRAQEGPMPDSLARWYFDAPVQEIDTGTAR
jgi:hypothetical protein